MNTRRALVSTAAVLLGLLLLLAALIAWLLAGGGAGWVLAEADRRMEALEVTRAQGSLAGGMRIERASWQQGSVQLIVEDLYLDLEPRGLLFSRVELAELRAEALTIALGPSEEPPDAQPGGLPQLSLPLILSVEHFAIDRLQIGAAGEEGLVLQDLGGALEWSGVQLQLEDGSLAWQGPDHTTRATLAGELRMRGPWPVNLALALNDPRLPGELRSAVDGTIETLLLDGSLDGPWPMQFEFQLQPLQPGLPLAGKVAVARPFDVTISERVLAVREGELVVDGKLDDLRGQAQARIGELLPEPIAISSDLRWYESALTLDALAIDAGDNHIGATCRIDTSPELQINCDGEAEFDALAQLTPLPAPLAISGPFSVSARPASNSRWLDLELPSLTGRYGEYAMNGELVLSSASGQRWSIQTLRLNVGDNQLRAAGHIEDRYDLRLALDAQALAQLHPALDGELSAKLDIGGPLAEPSVAGSASAPTISAGALRLEKLQLRADINQLLRESSDLEMTATSLRWQSRDMGRTAISANGDLAQMRVDVGMEDGDWGSAALDCQVSANDALTAVDLRCAGIEGTLALPDQTLAWQQTQPLILSFERTGNALRADPWCLRADSAELCLEDALVYRGKALQPLSITATGLPLSWLSAWVPEPWQQVGEARASARVDLDSLQPLQLSAEAQLPAISWSREADGETLEVGFEAIRAQADLDAEALRVDASFAARAGGTGTLDLRVAEPRGARLLGGGLVLQDLPLQPFAVLSPAVEELGGTARARVTFDGSLGAPEIAGALELEDVSAELQALDEPLRDVQLTGELGSDRLSFKGSFALGDGSGAVDGFLGWAVADSPWLLQATITGEALPLEPLPDSSLALSPDLELALTPQRLEVTGEVAIDRADIVLDDLPPRTVSPSPDTRVIGGNRKRPDSAFEVQSNIEVDLGPEFHFEGFGAELTLGGELRVYNDELGELRAEGQVDVEQGSYTAYGQNLVVRSGSLLFTGPLTNPDLNIEAMRKLPDASDVKAGLRVSGPLRSPTAELFSEPPMPESEIAHYVLTGRGSGDLGGGGGGYESTLLSLGLARGAEPAQKLAEKFGISDLQLGTVSGEGGTQADISGRLSEEVSVRYSTNITQESSAIILRYDLSDNLALELTRSVEDTLDFIYSFSID